MRRIFTIAISFVLGIAVFMPVRASAVIATNPTPNCSAGTTCTITFTDTSDFYAWTVPSGVTSITFSVRGGSGGKGCYIAYSRGGYGAVVTGNLSVNAGSILYIGVGAAGTDAYVGGVGNCSSSGVALSGSAGTNPFGSNGGGTTNAHSTAKGGGGGAASEIRMSSTTLIDRVVVAGGGGGGGGNYGSGTEYGGNASGNNGANGWANGTQGTSNTGKGATISNVGAGGGSASGSGAVGGSGTGGGGGGGGGYFGGGGSYYEGAGAGSSWTLGATSVSFASHSSAASGVVTITYLNSPIPTTFSTSQSSPGNFGTSTTVSYSLVLSQSVTDLATSDFQFGGTSSCNTPGLSGSGTTYTVTVSNCSEGSLILQLKANSITGTSAGPPSISSANTVVIDRTAPTISSVSAPTNGTYKPSDTPTFTIVFTESVTVTGTPRLTLTVGTATEYANFVSMSDSKTALFRYTVATDPIEFDTDGIAISTSLSLNSGSIQDLATNALTNLSFTAPTLTSVLVAQPAAAPTIDSITATSGQLAIYFTPGAARGSTTTTYQYSSNGGAFTNRPTGTTASPLIITGLTNGTGYTIRLRATTNAGAGDTSTAMTETPTSIAVTGDATLVLTYGNSASTTAYSASGGTNTFTWSLGSSLTGITLSGTTVTASSSTSAGIYSQTVRATDSNSQVGTKALTITVNKASTNISIALPGSATNAALGGAVTITATVPRAGAVNFMLGGTTISGCGSTAAASTTATCSWTPNALGSVSLTATFTPTDSSNFETSTTTTLSITVVNGISTVTLSLTGGTTTPPKGQAINIIAAVDQAGRITFMIDGKRIPGCNNKVANVGNVTCSWKPAIQKETVITARLVPTNNVYNASNSSLKVRVVRRSGLR